MQAMNPPMQPMQPMNSAAPSMNPTMPSMQTLMSPLNAVMSPINTGFKNLQQLPNAAMKTVGQVLPSPFGSQMNFGQQNQQMASPAMLPPTNGVQIPMNPINQLNQQRHTETNFDNFRNILHIEGSYVRTKTFSNSNRVHIFNMGNNVYIATQQNNNRRNNNSNNYSNGNQNLRRNNNFNGNNNNGQQQFRNNNNGHSNFNNNQMNGQKPFITVASTYNNLVDLSNYTKNAYSMYFTDYYGKDILVNNSVGNSQPQMLASSSYMQTTTI